MNQNDINRAFTEKVTELLGRSYQIYPGTMGGSQGEIAHDLPLNLETATNYIDSDGQTCYVYSWNTFFHSTAAPVGHNLLLALPCF